MPHAHDFDLLYPIIDLIENPLVTDSDTPVVFCAGKLLAVGRPWLSGESLDRRDNPRELGRGQFL
jgi:hypothetical protein